MPRLPYKPHDDAGPEEIVAPIRERRGGTLLNLDRQLLYSPPLALGWNHLMGAVRTRLTLPAGLREIAICCVATINGAPYEFHHHAPLLREAGATQAQVDALHDVDRACLQPELFDAAERATIRLAIEMTRSVQVAEETFERARGALGDDRQLVELIGTIASYNMVSRVIVALGIEPECEPAAETARVMPTRPCGLPSGHSSLGTDEDSVLACVARVAPCPAANQDTGDTT